jgi:hypothetical protein
VTTLEAREATRPLAGERQKGRVALVTVGTRGVGTAVGRSLACKPDGLGRPDRMARVALVLCVDACSGQVWPLNGSQEL